MTDLLGQGFVYALTNIKMTDDETGINICPHCENELKSGFLSVEDTYMYFIFKLRILSLVYSYARAVLHINICLYAINPKPHFT